MHGADKESHWNLVRRLLWLQVWARQSAFTEGGYKLLQTDKLQNALHQIPKKIWDSTDICDSTHYKAKQTMLSDKKKTYLKDKDSSVLTDTCLFFVIVKTVKEETIQHRIKTYWHTFWRKIGFALRFVRPVHKQVSKTPETGCNLIWNKADRMRSYHPAAGLCCSCYFLMPS